MVEEMFVPLRIWDFPMGQVDVMEGALSSCSDNRNPALLFCKRVYLQEQEGVCQISVEGVLSVWNERSTEVPEETREGI